MVSENIKQFLDFVEESKKLHSCRLDRRRYKDMVEEK